MQSLIEQAQQAVAEGAGPDDPRVRALGRTVATADLGTYRRARRGMGLSKRQARNRVAEIEGYDAACEARRRKAMQRTEQLVRRLGNGDPLAEANVRLVLAMMEETADDEWAAAIDEAAERDTEVRRARVVVSTDEETPECEGCCGQLGSDGHRGEVKPYRIIGNRYEQGVVWYCEEALAAARSYWHVESVVVGRAGR